MLVALIKQVMQECGLQQRALADVLGVELQRVKNITAGRVEKLTREEGEALIRKLHIRGDWLATGVGPMKQSPGEQELQRRLDAVGSARDVAVGMGLTGEQGRLMLALLYNVETGNGDGARKALAELTGLKPDEAALLDNYRHSPPDAQTALKATSAALAQCVCDKSAKRRA